MVCLPVRGTSPTSLYNKRADVDDGLTEEELESEDSGNFIKHDIKSKGVVITLTLAAATAAAEGGRLHVIAKRVTG